MCRADKRSLASSANGLKPLAELFSRDAVVRTARGTRYDSGFSWCAHRYSLTDCLGSRPSNWNDPDVDRPTFCGIKRNLFAIRRHQSQLCRLTPQYHNSVRHLSLPKNTVRL
jgi:hypothetical protein